MSSYECIAGGDIYDPAERDAFGEVDPGIAFEDLPDDRVCPDCGLGRGEFEKID